MLNLAVWHSIKQFLGTNVIEAIAVVLASVIVAVLTLVRKRVAKWVEQRKLSGLKMNVRISRQIHDDTVGVRAKLGAGRAFVARFHNGEIFSHSHPIWKVSWTEESVADGVMQMLAPDSRFRKGQVQDTLVNHVWEIVEPLFGDTAAVQGVRVESVGGRFIVIAFPKRMTEGVLRASLTFQGAAVRAVCPLYTDGHGGNPVGFVGVDYMDSKYEDPDNLQLDREALVEFAKRVEFYLQNKSVSK